MVSVHRLAVVGFSRFERSTLESYFRLATGNADGYEICADLHHSDLVVADADLQDAVRAVRRAGRARDTVFIGAGPTPSSAAARLPRPIDALQVRRALDAAAHRRPSRPSGRALQQDADARQQVGDFHDSSVYSNSVLVAGESRLDGVLIVGAHPAERQVLHDLLRGYGYRVTVAGGCDEAPALCDEQEFGFVFLGLGENSLDGFQACRRIKRRQTPSGPAPTVVALASHPGTMDRVRATFAGCDAYLPVPLDEAALLRMLVQHDRTFERVFEPTAPIPL